MIKYIQSASRALSSINSQLKGLCILLSLSNAPLEFTTMDVVQTFLTPNLLLMRSSLCSVLEAVTQKLVLSPNNSESLGSTPRVDLVFLDCLTY